MADLPQSFLDSMKEILGEDYEAFLAGFDGQRQYGLRVNTLKMNLEESERIAPFHLKKVPWISNGYFYEAEDALRSTHFTVPDFIIYRNRVR